MRLLVLGGTRFLGRAVVEDAISRGHDVTTFSRGLSGEPRPGTEVLHGDRTRSEDLRRLAEGDWDGVIDTSTLAPAHVLASARLLAGHADHYTYVSSVSVYRDFPAEPVAEGAPIHACPPDAEGDAESLGYAQLKAGAERAVAAALPGRNLLVRPGVIVGPHEDVGRLPWWLKRLARGGPALAPGPPDRPVRLTDARDLAAWLVDNTRRGISGEVNVPGAQASFGELLDACAEATAPQRAVPLDLRWADDQALLEAGVQPWTELPLWAPGSPEFAGLWEVSGDRALRTGIRYRPIADTVRDTWTWMAREAARAGCDVAELDGGAGVGLDPARERAALAAL